MSDPRNEVGGNMPSTSPSDKKDDGEGDINKLLMKELMTKGGLNNDTYALVSQWESALKSQAFDPIGISSNTDNMISMIGKVNELRRNLDAHTDAKKNKDKVRVMTNYELLEARENDMALKGNKSIFTIAESSMGMEKITENIKGLLSLIKQDSSSSDVYTTDATERQNKIREAAAQLTGKKPSNEELEGLAALAKAPTALSEAPDGIYKKSTTHKEASARAIEAAKKFIWNSFDNNVKNKIKAVAIQNGEDNPLSLIENMITADHNVTHEVKYDQVKDKDGNGVDKDGKSTKKVSRSPMELAVTGGFNRTGEYHTINNPGTGAKMQVKATYTGALMSLKGDGHSIGPSKLSTVLNGEEGLNQIMDNNNAYLGDQKINPQLLQDLVYSGEEVARVMMPVDSNGNPDMRSLSKFTEVQKEFDSKKDSMTIQQAEKLFRDAGFLGTRVVETQDENGNVKKVIAESSHVKPFWGIPVLTNSASDLAASPWMYELKGGEADAAEKTMDAAFTTNQGTNSKPKLVNTSPSGWFSLEKPLASMVYLKERPNASGIVASRNNNLLGTPAYEEDMRRNLQYSSQPTARIDASANKLNN